MSKYKKEIQQLINNCSQYSKENTWLEIFMNSKHSNISIKKIYMSHILDYSLDQLQNDPSFLNRLTIQELDKIIMLRNAIAPTENNLENLQVLSLKEAFDPQTMMLSAYINKILCSCQRGWWLFDWGKTNGLLYEAVVAILHYLDQVDYLTLHTYFYQQNCQTAASLPMLGACTTTGNVIKIKNELDNVSSPIEEDFTSFLQNNE